jgi:hypothetical protein
VQGAQQEGVGQACKAEAKAGTACCRASSATQEESKASSTALGKEGINRIERVSSAGAGARGGSSSSSSSDELGVGSSSGIGTTAGPRYQSRA